MSLIIKWGCFLKYGLMDKLSNHFETKLGSVAFTDKFEY